MTARRVSEALAAALALSWRDPQRPNATELAAFEERCRAADLVELGHLLFTAPTRSHAVLAERVANERMARTSGLSNPPPRHGVDCAKAPHLGGGHLHEADDDRPYRVDGVEYCGRCHVAL